MVCVWLRRRYIHGAPVAGWSRGRPSMWPKAGVWGHPSLHCRNWEETVQCVQIGGSGFSFTGGCTAPQGGVTRTIKIAWPGRRLREIYHRLRGCRQLGFCEPAWRAAHAGVSRCWGAVLPWAGLPVLGCGSAVEGEDPSGALDGAGATTCRKKVLQCSEPLRCAQPLSEEGTAGPQVWLDGSRGRDEAVGARLSARL